MREWRDGLPILLPGAGTCDHSWSSCPSFPRRFPIVKDHLLAIPYRHVASYFDLTAEELHDCNSLLRRQATAERRPGDHLAESADMKAEKHEDSLLVVARRLRERAATTPSEQLRDYLLRQASEFERIAGTAGHGPT